MNNNFTNKPLIWSLNTCSVFVAFVAILGTLQFRQKSFLCAERIKQIETMEFKINNEKIEISKLVAHMQTPSLFKENLFPSQVNELKNRVFKVTNWRNYKESFMTRNSLAVNYTNKFQF